MPGLTGNPRTVLRQLSRADGPMTIRDLEETTGLTFDDLTRAVDALRHDLLARADGSDPRGEWQYIPTDRGRRAANPLTVDDIPAGQGPASLFLRPDSDGGLSLWFNTAHGLAVNIHAPRDFSPATPNLAAGEAALWEHLAATLRTVTRDTGEA